jgi:hypothetical protein
VSLCVVLLVASGVPFLTGGAAALEVPEEGFRYVGEIPERAGTTTYTNNLGEAFVDPVRRLAFVWRDQNGGAPFGSQVRGWDVFSLDDFTDVVDGDGDLLGRQATQMGVATYPTPPPGTTAQQLTSTTADPQRNLADGHGTVRMIAIDPARGRMLFAARGAVYEARYADADGVFQSGDATLSKWVAAPNPGGLTHAHLGSGLNHSQTPVFVTRGVSFYEADEGPRLYTVGYLDAVTTGESLLITGWDAAPGNGATIPSEDPEEPDGPVRRDLWVYHPTTCRRPVNANLRGQALIMRTPTALYIACDAAVDRGTSKGVLRLPLSKDNVFAPGEMAPTGEEEFFPGIVGPDVEMYGDTFIDSKDKQRERIYALVRNASGRSRRVIAFDSGVGNGAYVGVFPVVDVPIPPRFPSGAYVQPGPAAAAVNPETGRWYLVGPDGLRFQDGRLSTVPQATRVRSDLDHPNDGLLLGELAQNGVEVKGTERAPKIDPSPPSGRPRVLIWHPAGIVTHPGGKTSACAENTNGCWKIYEDFNPVLDFEPRVDEFTLNVQESDETSGSFSGRTSAYGLRARFIRGLSSFWPSSLGGVSLEGNPNKTEPANFPGDWQTDPFYYYAGDCYARDFELTTGRVFESVLESDGLETDAASARALAVDPDVHRKGAGDDTTLRRELANPDPVPTTTTSSTTTTAPGATTTTTVAPRADPGEGCARQFFETMTHASAESDPAEGNFNRFGQRWPYEPVACSGKGSDDHAVGASDAAEGNMLPMAVSASAQVECKADRGWADTAQIQAVARSTTSPAELGALVTVEDVITETSSVREPLKGLRSSARVAVKGVTIGGVVEIDEVRTEVSVHAPGYQRDAEGDTPAVDATTSVTREFFGLSVAGQRVCAECSSTQVVSAINDALGNLGYARAPEPEPNFKLGTKKGTTAVIQKGIAQQSADLIMNKDDSTEWPSLELVIYRDAEQRGSGRWILQVGGIFAQANFSVISRLGDEGPPPTDPPPDDPGGTGGTDDPGGTGGGSGGTAGSAGTPGIAGSEGRRVAVALPFEKAASEGPLGAFGGSPDPGDALRRIVEALSSLKGAFLLASLWLVVYGPVYVARRRALLHRVVTT